MVRCLGLSFVIKSGDQRQRQWPQRVRSCKISQNLAVSDVVGGGERVGSALN
jgi:hypothetical protein